MTEQNAAHAVEKTANEAMHWLASNQELMVQYAMNILTAVLILLIGHWVVKKVAGSVGTVLKKRNLDQTVVDFIENMARYVMFAIVLIAALGRLGVETASIVAVIGAAGLAIGLALQGSLSNFAAGVLIVTFRPFKSGDYVEVGGVAGSVASIQIFSTVLTTPDNKMVVVPNGTVISSPITNYSRHETRRIDFIIGVFYKADLQKTKEVLTRVVMADERVLKDPEPTVGVHALMDSSVNFVVRPWVNTADYWSTYFDLLQAIKEELDKEGIEIPFPQMDVHYYANAKEQVNSEPRQVA
ncbi:small-conductance mechanosensitive channel MscS [Enterovibrio nigricans]|uniref:Small-conductance mechanosensitive channel n=1 Tax=Enterovibrio nigricans DSM 22720 TaxID=1121868 RepID=A0A1T4TYQ4_9GAMM|nr:small-conductance mechanosensitive channel MscS [Enterovibrio nigricans]PKF51643.1 mechanosensitive ion channel protein [Enterovibrio nigricans]SKA45602.1 small conductance mechanosensitive channel [Enterovibrio nigricans DSM 22720]